MTHILTSLHRNVTVVAPLIVQVPQNSTTPDPVGGNAHSGTQILPDQTAIIGEIASIYIQNVGANAVYISIGVTGCDSTALYHTLLSPLQQKSLDSRQSVWAFCPASGGTQIAIEQYNRNAFPR